MPALKRTLRTGRLLLGTLIIFTDLLAAQSAAPPITPQIAPAALTQNTTPNLTSISAISAATPKVVFSFDADVTSYAASTYKVTSLSKGVANTSSALAAFDPTSPKSISVPLDFSGLVAADSVQVSVTLADNSHQILTTPFYSLDLSFVKAVKGYQDQIVSLFNDNGTLRAQNASCQTERANLIKKASPQQFDYQGPELVGPTTVVLRFQTDKYATIQITDIETGKAYTSVGVEHHVKIPSLAPGGSHTFKAIPVDYASQPSQASKFLKTISVQTPDIIPFAPTIVLSSTTPTSITARVDFDPTGAHPSFKGYIMLHYRQVIDQAAGIYSQPIDVGDGSIDTNGIPKGTAFTGSHDFVISVAPGKTYNVSYTAYDEYGDVVNYPAPGAFATTGNLPVPLGFKGPIAVTMNSDTGLTMSWSANRAVQKVEMSAKFPDGTIVIPPIKKDITSQTSELSVSTDLSGLATLLDKAVKSKDAPILTISMSDGTNDTTGSATVSMSVTFVVSKSAGTDPIQHAATQVATAAAQKNTKVDWKTLIASGLGIVLKAL